MFTQYDKRVKEHFAEWMDTPEAEELPRKEGRKIAAQAAYQDWEQNYKEQLMSLVCPGKSNLSICRVGFSKGSEVDNDGLYQADNRLGTSALINETFNCLSSDKLRSIWMAAQRQRIDLLLKVSVETCVDYFWTLRKYTYIPMPGVAAVMLKVAYGEARVRLNEIWNIKTEPRNLLEKESRRLLIACFGTYSSGDWVQITVMGPLIQSLMTCIVFNVVVACSLFFERLSWLQQVAGDNCKPLTKKEFEREADKFAKSQERIFCSEFIMYTVRSGLSKQSIRDIAQQIIDTAKIEGQLGAKPTAERRRSILKHKLKKMGIKYERIPDEHEGSWRY